MNTFKQVLKIILLLIAIAVVGFIIYSCVTNTSSCRKNSVNPSIPTISEAPFKATEVVTGNIFYAKVIVTTGQKVGSCIHTVKGVWELVHDVYVYKDIDVVLDEAAFGEIKVERRK